MDMLNNVFVEINRDSQLLENPSPQSLEKIYDEIKREYTYVTKYIGSFVYAC